MPKLKVKGMLYNNATSKMERSYLNNVNFFETDVACEYEFRAINGFIDHLGREHGYLPCLCLQGYIESIKGDFPYDVSEIYFSDDKVKRYKEFVYIPTPSEINHAISVGCFYTKSFELPSVIKDNTYSFPGKVRLLTIAPDNNLDEQMQVPLFYTKFLGTNVSKKNDRLLRYYNIDIDDEYEIYPLTAESSGYVNPPLFNYIPQATVEYEDTMDYNKYLTKEDEIEMLKFQQEMVKEQPEVAMVEDIIEPTREEVFLANASKRIGERVEERVEKRRFERERLAIAKRLDEEREIHEEYSKQADEQSVLTEIESERVTERDFANIENINAMNNVFEDVVQNENVDNDFEDVTSTSLNRENIEELSDTEIVEDSDDLFEDVSGYDLFNDNEIENSVDNDSTNTGTVEEFKPLDMFEDVDNSSDSIYYDENSDFLSEDLDANVDVENINVQRKLDEKKTNQLIKDAALNQILEDMEESEMKSDDEYSL